MTTSTKVGHFKGRPFNYVTADDYEASWWTFVDEQAVRDTFWDIKEGDVVLDIGSALGSYALSALACGAAYVDCWTPDKKEQTFLGYSLRANHWESKAFVHTMGLWDQPGWLHLLHDEKNQLKDRQFSLEQPTPVGNPVDMIFKVDSLDAIRERLKIWPTGPAYWLKLDTEGAEPEILKGAQKFIRENRPKILLENHDFCRPNATELAKGFLESEGYSLKECRPHYMVSHSLFLPNP